MGYDFVGERTKAVPIIHQMCMKNSAEVALADAAATLTAQQLIDSGIFKITPSAARALTTATAAQIVTYLKTNAEARIGAWFEFTVVCLAAFAVTLTAGTGVTIVGSAAANNVSATFCAVITQVEPGAETITIYRR